MTSKQVQELKDRADMATYLDSVSTVHANMCADKLLQHLRNVQLRGDATHEWLKTQLLNIIETARKELRDMT